MQRANASLSFCSTVSPWVAWRRRIWPAWDLVLKTRLYPAYSPSMRDRILSVSQLRLQFSVAIAPSCDGEWDSTWRGDQNAEGGAETSHKNPKLFLDPKRGKRWNEKKIPPDEHSSLSILYLSFRPSKTIPPTYPCPLLITFS